MKSDDEGENISEEEIELQPKELKEGISRLIEPHAVSINPAVITWALVELGVERMFGQGDTEEYARIVVNSVFQRILDQKAI